MMLDRSLKTEDRSKINTKASTLSARGTSVYRRVRIRSDHFDTIFLGKSLSDLC